ncbi:MAG: 3-oxoacyl-[acyl-carrier-protein] reductase [Desulfobacteraceae bacterium]|jgi:3-oxoacyl-[acyl-carrier protein] reductase|nr:3-oxoacyl-[acyl-carrier-protein] reductase [Desulfobacteraceae bacterium]
MTSDIKRTIVVTGGSKGIGRAICKTFAAPGVTIYFNFNSPQTTGQETEEEIFEAGGIARGMRVDVSSEAEVTNFFNTIIDDTGRIDVLVNNAGIAKDALLLRMKEQDWDDVIRVNLKGTFNCTKAAAKTMLKQRYGRIINIASIAGVAGNPGQANYAASKAGIIGLTKTVARELGSRGITANAIAPGFIQTDMTAGLSEKALSDILSQIPLGRNGTPEDIAGVALFLASKSADYITGQVIHVNGGMYI